MLLRGNSYVNRRFGKSPLWRVRMPFRIMVLYSEEKQFDTCVDVEKPPLAGGARIGGSPGFDESPGFDGARDDHDRCRRKRIPGQRARDRSAHRWSLGSGG